MRLRSSSSGLTGGLWAFEKSFPPSTKEVRGESVSFGSIAFRKRTKSCDRFQFFWSKEASGSKKEVNIGSDKSKRGTYLTTTSHIAC